MIISVGYRIKSHVATRFRQWATQRLREYIVKGFTLDDERLKTPICPLIILMSCFAGFRTFALRNGVFTKKLPTSMPPVLIMIPQLK